jgi:ribose-phosphate pyrophosphokinase
MKLFAGSANPPLGQKIAEELGVPLAQAEIVRFENSEIRIRIAEDVKNEECYVIQPTANPSDTHLMELFFFCDALRRMEAKKVYAVIPYFGYARQDIQHRDGECVSANVVITFLESIGFAKVYTVNIHDEATQGVFSIPYKDISALPLLADTVKDYLREEGVYDVNKVTVLSPDQGGVERARKFSEELFPDTEVHLAVIEKKRNLNKIHTSRAVDIYGDVKGRNVILVDDMTTSGGTLINAAHLCKEKGARQMLAVIVHHDFAPDAPEKIQASHISKFFTTNTIFLKKGQSFPKLQEVSVAKLIAEALKK